MHRLKKAARMWQKTLGLFFTGMGFSVSWADPSLSSDQHDLLVVLVAVYMDYVPIKWNNTDNKQNIFRSTEENVYGQGF